MACKNNDARAAAETLLQMAAVANPEKAPKTLPALAQILESGSQEINALDRILYAGDVAAWDADSCYGTFKDGLSFKTSQKKTNEALAPLYPG